MKTILIPLMLVVSTVSSPAVITALATDFDIAFTDTSNIAIPEGTGFVASGYFLGLNDGDIASSGISVIDTAFQQFTAQTGTFGSSGFGGFVNYSSSAQRVGSSSPFFGKSLYFVFGNATTLTASDQLAVYKAALTFPDDSAASSDADLNVKLGGASPTAGAFLMGTTGGTTSIASTSIPAVQMQQVIPEPSTLLLFLVGGLGILRRRR